MKCRIIFVLAVAISVGAHATTFVVPSDAALVHESKAIVVGTVLTSYARYDTAGRIETVAEISVERVVKGLVPAPLRVIEPGGEIGDEWCYVPGSPRYVTGERVLLFLGKRGNGEWATHDMTLGRFRFVLDSAGRSLLVREAREIHGWDESGGAHRERPRLSGPFLAWVQSTARGETAPADYYLAQAAVSAAESLIVQPDFTPSQYAATLGDFPGRRQNPTVSFRIAGDQPGLDIREAATIATAAWTNDPFSNVNYSVSDVPASGDTLDTSDGEERIIANDPHDEIEGTFTNSGTVATAYFSGRGTHTFAGETYTTITGSDVIIQNGVSGSNLTVDQFRTTLTHEIGHTLGFRHSDKSPDDSSDCADPLPCSGNAVMNSFIIRGFNGALQSWDIDAVRALYGSGSACTAPSIVSQPVTVSVPAGRPATLSIFASGTEPLQYQWYRGAQPDTSSPVGTSSPTFQTPGITAPAAFWVRVSNSCGEQLSSTITVQPFAPISGRPRAVGR